MSRRGKILFIDAYDSFSNNIISLLQSELSALVEVIKTDDPRFILNHEAFSSFLDNFDAVVAGPGPGHPAVPRDVGLIAKLWHLPDNHLLPVLGICLGFQSLALAFGAVVERLQEPRHGIVTSVMHCDSDIFADTGEIDATQYHSLHVRLRKEDFPSSQRELWRPSKSCKQLVPLARDMSDSVNGPTLMAVRHCHKPFWGVQYHPESICTNVEGRKIILNWWDEVCAWRLLYSKEVGSDTPQEACRSSNSAPFHSPPSRPNLVQWRSMDLPDGIDVTDVGNILRETGTDSEPLVLESGLRDGKPVNAETGCFSIIGVHDKSSMHIRYSTSSHQLDVVCNEKVLVGRNSTISCVFDFLEKAMEERRAADGPAKVPFWGGLIGFVSYEAGLETIDVAPPESGNDRPDVWFVFVERSIVVDHVERTAYMQSLRENDGEWLVSMEQKLLRRQLKTCACCNLAISSMTPLATDIVYSPEQDNYEQSVLQCQSYLRAGLSYELCHTDTSSLRTKTDAWGLYRRLRNLNPAPFAAYMDLSSACLPTATPSISVVSSSPERFLSWSREGRCQFRPIKGTLKKTASVDAAVANKVLSSPKERAENLMIVDLIRHDLSGVEGVRDVSVPKLMSIEEYQTVYQLTSTIEGRSENGIAVLAASLPPGSMTGAPKKRSCDLLKCLEAQEPRGLYAGVLGYMDVGGGGDFSVLIRTAFKWGDEDLWRVGAGGAVTVLSEAEGEWKEMLAKRESVLQAFC